MPAEAVISELEKFTSVTKISALTNRRLFELISIAQFATDKLAQEVHRRGLLRYRFDEAALPYLIPKELSSSSVLAFNITSGDEE